MREFLKRRPSIYSDIHPEFLQQLGAGWKKHEKRPDLTELLKDNFLQYEGQESVPSQIHNYLSTNFKDMRNLKKDDLSLKKKAIHRWYVPDPNKESDIEKTRTKSLLKEFELYKNSTKKKLTEFRAEALRAGFAAAYNSKNFQAILDVSKKIPEETLQEDETLLMYYDYATMVAGE